MLFVTVAAALHRSADRNIRPDTRGVSGGFQTNRLVFELIACEDVRVVMTQLAPAAAVRPVVQVSF